MLRFAVLLTWKFFHVSEFLRKWKYIDRWHAKCGRQTTEQWRANKKTAEKMGDNTSMTKHQINNKRNVIFKHLSIHCDTIKWLSFSLSLSTYNIFARALNSNLDKLFSRKKNKKIPKILEIKSFEIHNNAVVCECKRDMPVTCVINVHTHPANIYKLYTIHT